jgi:hypothetical protein
MVDASLCSLSQYCSYVYDSRQQKSYSDIHQSLDTSIQAGIHKIRHSKCAENSLWYGVVYTRIMCTLGMNNMS